jgi:hypothetical protein
LCAYILPVTDNDLIPAAKKYQAYAETGLQTPIEAGWDA